MDIPEGIEKDIVSYIRMECGEDPSDPRTLKESDLTYEGEFEIQGVPTHYWRCGKDSRLWATIEPYGDSYCMSMTSSSPKPILKSELYSHLKIEDFSGEFSERIPLPSLGKSGSVGLPDYKEITLPSGEIVAVLAEAHPQGAPPSVTVSIQDAAKDIYIRASVGIALSYTTSGGNELLLSIGTGPWE